MTAILLSGTVISSSASNTYNYRVRTDIDYDLNVRPYPNTDHASLGKILRGEKIFVSETQKDSTNRLWGKITYNGNDAWVCLNYCTKITEEQPVVIPEIPDDMKVNWTIVDVSQHQIPKEIDWEKLKKSGVNGVIIRIGGTYVNSQKIYSDDQFKNHYDRATAAGMYVGVYFFSYALTKEGALEEANFVTNTLKKYDCKLTLPVFIDIEDYSTGNYIDTKHRQIGTAVCNEIVNTFCDTVKAAGCYPGIYCNLDYTRTVLSPSVFKGRAVWIAQWADKCTYKGEYHMWQYTENGRFDGYAKNLDASECYLNFPKLISEGKTEDPYYPFNPSLPLYYGEHPASDWKIIKQATCNEEGKRIRECTDKGCGITLAEEIIQPSFGSHKRSVAYVSLVDKDIKAGTVLMPNVERYLHEAKEKSSFGVTYEDAFKTSGGVKLTYCKTCDTILTVSYSYGNGCEHTNVKKSEQSPTCTTAGLETDTCVSCGKLAATRYVSPKSHTEGVPQSTATCVSEGISLCRCTSCDAVIKKEYAEKTEHTFSGDYTRNKADEFDGTVSAQIKCTACDCYTIINAMYGAPDNSGKITVSDARTALRFSVNLDCPTPLQKIASDVDFNELVTVADARYILRMAVNLEDAQTLYKQFSE